MLHYTTVSPFLPTHPAVSEHFMCACAVHCTVSAAAITFQRPPADVCANVPGPCVTVSRHCACLPPSHCVHRTVTAPDQRCVSVRQCSRAATQRLLPPSHWTSHKCNTMYSSSSSNCHQRSLSVLSTHLSHNITAMMWPFITGRPRRHTIYSCDGSGLPYPHIIVTPPPSSAPHPAPPASPVPLVDAHTTVTIASRSTCTSPVLHVTSVLCSAATASTPLAVPLVSSHARHISLGGLYQRQRRLLHHLGVAVCRKLGRVTRSRPRSQVKRRTVAVSVTASPVLTSCSEQSHSHTVPPIPHHLGVAPLFPQSMLPAQQYTHALSRHQAPICSSVFSLSASPTCSVSLAAASSHHRCDSYYTTDASAVCAHSVDVCRRTRASSPSTTMIHGTDEKCQVSASNRNSMGFQITSVTDRVSRERSSDEEEEDDEEDDEEELEQPVLLARAVTPPPQAPTAGVRDDTHTCLLAGTWHSRFRVIALSDSECPRTYTRGRWACRDFSDAGRRRNIAAVATGGGGGGIACSLPGSCQPPAAALPDTCVSLDLSLRRRMSGHCVSAEDAGNRRARDICGVATADTNDSKNSSISVENVSTLPDALVEPIDNKIEQAMDLVKSHLLLAVNEEVSMLRSSIGVLTERIVELERENQMLRNGCDPATLAALISSSQPAPAQVSVCQQVTTSSRPAISAAAAELTEAACDTVAGLQCVQSHTYSTHVS